MDAKTNYKNKLSEIENYLYTKEYEKAIECFTYLLNHYDVFDAKYYYLYGKLMEDNNKIDYAIENYWIGFTQKGSDWLLKYHLAKAIERIASLTQECKIEHCLYAGKKDGNHILHIITKNEKFLVEEDLVVCTIDDLKTNDFVDVYLCTWEGTVFATSINFVKRVLFEKNYKIDEFNIYEGKENYLFVSYSHKDQQEVLHIIDALQARGFRIWFDRGIEAGTEWPQNIAEHIINSSCVLSLMSTNASKSQNCRNEINFALKNNKNFITFI